MLISAVPNSNIMNSKTNFRNTSNPAFRGNLVTLASKEILHNVKTSRFVEETGSTLARKAKGIVNKRELPVTKNPIVAADLKDDLQEEAVQQIIGGALGQMPVVGPVIQVAQLVYKIFRLFG